MCVSAPPPVIGSMLSGCLTLRSTRGTGGYFQLFESIESRFLELDPGMSSYTQTFAIGGTIEKIHSHHLSRSLTRIGTRSDSTRIVYNL